MTLFWVFLCAAFFAGLIGLNAERLGATFGLMDVPDPVGGRKRHQRITPLMGGVAVMIPTLAAAAWVILTGPGDAFAGYVFWFMTAVAILFFVGLLDDRYSLSPRLRLLLAIGAFSLAMLQAPDFSLFFIHFSWTQTPFLLGQLGAVFALVCVVGLQNAVNMADGKNGLVIGMSLIWTGFLAHYAPASLLPVYAALGGALLVTFWFNWFGRLFLGDGGSYGLSAAFGLLAILTYNQGFERLPADVVAVWFSIPVLDCVRLMMVRAFRRQSPFVGDRDHLHHHLHRTLPWRWGLAIYLSLVLGPGLLAIHDPSWALAALILSGVSYVVALTGATVLASVRQSA
jgi:UDP-GlcNAc:undecaprenyl-phosphate/decaprenyl-phosphate GlcNAc-1-phosphate transferase